MKVIYFKVKCPYCDRKVKMRIFPDNGDRQALPFSCGKHIFFLFYNDGKTFVLKNLEDFKGYEEGGF
jgi:hypothetical protein